jgi:hypothetical protein
MAKKAKAKKTTTPAKKKETAAKPGAQEEKQSALPVDAQPQLDVPIDAAKAGAQEAKQAEPAMATQTPLDAPSELVEPVIPEPKRLDVPPRDPSVAMTTRKPAPVPVAVPETPPESPTQAAPPEPVASEPPLTGILAILQVKTEEGAGVTEGNLATYRAYIDKNLERPVRVCGREPFGWERPYAWGLRDPGEYAKRKEKCPSYTDALEIVGFDEEVDTLEGIAVRVSRPADGKEFTLLLGSLKSVDAASKNAEILDDFTKWFTEGR